MEEPTKPKDLKLIAENFQINEDGISVIYVETHQAIIDAENILQAYPSEELKEVVLQTILKFSTYSEYAVRQKKISGVGPAYFITTGRGREIVIRLEEIATEIKSMAVSSYEKLDKERIKKLCREALELVKK